MRFRPYIGILSLVALVSCSDWDRQGPPIPTAPHVLTTQSPFVQLCADVRSGKSHGRSTDTTFLMLYKLTGSKTCQQAVTNIEALTALDLSNELSTRTLLDLNLIAQIPNLQKLVLRQQQITTVEPLAALKNLVELDISETGVNQDLSKLGLGSLPLERLRRLRVSVQSTEPHAFDELTRMQLNTRFLDRLKANEMLVIAHIDRGNLYTPLSLPADPQARQTVIAEWKAGKHASDAEELGTFVDYSEITPEPTPAVIYHRGYALDYAVVSDVRDAEGAKVHLLAEFARDGEGNEWHFPLDAINKNLLQVIIEAEDVTVGATGRPGAVRKAAAQEAK